MRNFESSNNKQEFQGHTESYTNCTASIALHLLRISTVKIFAYDLAVISYIYLYVLVFVAILHTCDIPIKVYAAPCH